MTDTEFIEGMERIWGQIEELLPGSSSNFMRLCNLARRGIELEKIVSESSGVVGFHLNGDIATWDELLADTSESEGER